METLYSTTESFVSKVMAVINIINWTKQINCYVIDAFDPNSPHNQDNPLGRIPALQLDNGEWLFGSLLISEYLDSIGHSNCLFHKGNNVAA